ncbi:MaoC family dehydratase N-terminal domain-containing protein [Desmospora profundinema]|uniref:Acyl dehydratase n=1 Tax=Desmospora profundinema TaxID=1571184 RepID=A0ABU1ILP0_9BACL|nr:MaoC family dehydratase N-terminal domain-containing protein [Desmospora profundinema]MDR6225686.1 acyl dehydratase [Desmospora profundinema]
MWTHHIGSCSKGERNVVEEGAVRKFVEAIGDFSPLYLDEVKAKNSRYGKRIAPPTFPITFRYGSIEGLPLPESGLIHGDQRFEYQRPLFVGEEVLCSLMLKDAFEKKGKSGSLHFLVFDRIGKDPDGGHIFTACSTVIVTEAVRKEGSA